MANPADDLLKSLQQNFARKDGDPDGSLKDTLLKMAYGIGIVLLIALLFSSFISIGPGERGVLFNIRSGVQKSISLDEGIHFIIPYYERVYIYSIRVAKEEFQTEASSQDLQAVQVMAVVNFHLDPQQVATICQEVGSQYTSRIIKPSVEESVKAVVAKYNATELISKRPEVKAKAQEILIERLADYHILVDDLSLTDFVFSQEFKKAIEAKQVAEQQALQRKYELQKAQKDAEIMIAEAEGKKKSRIAEAQGEAEAQRLLQKSITSGVIELRRIEKWNGTLPKVVSDGALVQFSTQPPRAAQTTQGGSQ